MLLSLVIPGKQRGLLSLVCSVNIPKWSWAGMFALSMLLDTGESNGSDAFMDLVRLLAVYSVHSLVHWAT